MLDLSVLIPARQEMFLAKTVEDVLAHSRGDTEVIVVLDGAWADPQLPDHPRLRITHSAAVIGQRAATNLAARLSQATYVMKLDAHCSVAEGFDVALIQAAQELGPDVTQIPSMRNLHAFWRQCKACGHQMYQGPMHVPCEQCAVVAGFERVMVWQPRRGTKTESWRFDHDLHFQYWNDFKHRPEAQGELVDVMSSVGACFFMRRDRFWQFGGMDETAGSWGQYGVEIACKSWLSGGRHVVNKRTWFAHMFRTQGADFGFPYVMRGADQEHAREHSRSLWLTNTWPQQTRPLSWLLEKFGPVAGWHDAADEEANPKTEEKDRARILALREQRLRDVQVAGIAFYVQQKRAHTNSGKSGEAESMGAGGGRIQDRDHGTPSQGGSAGIRRTLTKGFAYYSDCRGDPAILEAVRAQLTRCAQGRRIVSATLQPVDFGDNVVLPLERGPLTMFRQILAALEALDTDIAFLTEHDVAYHPSHFDFVPPRNDTFYFNNNRWQVSAVDGRAVHYRASQTSGCCASRALLFEHYRKRIAYVEQHGWDRNIGFEPGTNARSRAIDPHGAETWMSPFPNIDIRHGHNLSKTRWSVAEFHDKRTCQGWVEADAVPGWGVTRGRFAAFLSDIGKKGS